MYHLCRIIAPQRPPGPKDSLLQPPTRNQNTKSKPKIKNKIKKLRGKAAWGCISVRGGWYVCIVAVLAWSTWPPIRTYKRPHTSGGGKDRHQPPPASGGKPRTASARPATQDRRRPPISQTTAARYTLQALSVIYVNIRKNINKHKKKEISYKDIKKERNHNFCHGYK